MSRILFLTVDGGGNLPPALAIADELAGRGHDILFLGTERQEQRIVGHGHRFRPYRHGRPWSGEDRRNPGADVRDFVRLITDRGYATDLEEQIREAPVDAAVVDCLIPGSIRGAASLPTRVITLMHSTADAWLRAPAFRIAGVLGGLSPRRAWESAEAVLVTTSARLDPAHGRLPAMYRWTGVCETMPAVPAAPSDPPHVLVSLSTMYIAGQDRVLQRILDAVDGLPIRVTVTTGPTIDPRGLRTPSNATVRRWLPHGEVLPSCSAVICHGGHSTTARALAHGVPVIAVPMNELIDQPMIAAAVQRAGAGMHLKKSASVTRLREGLVRVLADAAFTRGASELGAALRAESGPAVAADVVSAGTAARTSRG